MELRCDDLQVLKLQAPPKTKFKRQLSSDSDTQSLAGVSETSVSTVRGTCLSCSEFLDSTHSENRRDSRKLQEALVRLQHTSTSSPSLSSAFNFSPKRFRSLLGPVPSPSKDCPATRSFLGPVSSPSKDCPAARSLLGPVPSPSKDCTTARSLLGPIPSPSKDCQAVRSPKRTLFPQNVTCQSAAVTKSVADSCPNVTINSHDLTGWKSREPRQLETYLPSPSKAQAADLVTRNEHSRKKNINFPEAQILGCERDLKTNRRSCEPDIFVFPDTGSVKSIYPQQTDEPDGLDIPMDTDEWSSREHYRGLTQKGHVYQSLDFQDSFSRSYNNSALQTSVNEPYISNTRKNFAVSEPIFREQTRVNGNNQDTVASCYVPCSPELPYHVRCAGEKTFNFADNFSSVSALNRQANFSNTLDHNFLPTPGKGAMPPVKGLSNGQLDEASSSTAGSSREHTPGRRQFVQSNQHPGTIFGHTKGKITREHAETSSCSLTDILDTSESDDVSRYLEVEDEITCYMTTDRETTRPNAVYRRSEARDRINTACVDRKCQSETGDSPVITSADTNVCYVSLNESGSSMSTDDMEYGCDNNNNGSFVFVRHNSYSQQDVWDETDGKGNKIRRRQEAGNTQVHYLNESSSPDSKTSRNTTKEQHALKMDHYPQAKNRHEQSTQAKKNHEQSTQAKNKHEQSTQAKNRHERSTQAKNNHEQSTQAKNRHEESTQAKNRHEESTQAKNRHEESTQAKNNHEQSTQAKNRHEQSTQAKNRHEESTQAKNRHERSTNTICVPQSLKQTSLTTATRVSTVKLKTDEKHWAVLDSWTNSTFLSGEINRHKDSSAHQSPCLLEESKHMKRFSYAPSRLQAIMGCRNVVDGRGYWAQCQNNGSQYDYTLTNSQEDEDFADEVDGLGDKKSKRTKSTKDASSKLGPDDKSETKNLVSCFDENDLTDVKSGTSQQLAPEQVASSEQFVQDEGAHSSLADSQQGKLSAAQISRETSASQQEILQLLRPGISCQRGKERDLCTDPKNVQGYTAIDAHIRRRKSDTSIVDVTETCISRSQSSPSKLGLPVDSCPDRTRTRSSPSKLGLPVDSCPDRTRTQSSPSKLGLPVDSCPDRTRTQSSPSKLGLPVDSCPDRTRTQSSPSKLGLPVDSYPDRTRRTFHRPWQDHPVPGTQTLPRAHRTLKAGASSASERRMACSRNVDLTSLPSLQHVSCPDNVCCLFEQCTPQNIDYQTYSSPRVDTEGFQEDTPNGSKNMFNRTSAECSELGLKPNLRLTNCRPKRKLELFAQNYSPAAAKRDTCPARGGVKTFSDAEDTHPSYHVGDSSSSTSFVGDSRPDYHVGETRPDYNVGETRPDYHVGETRPDYHVGDTRPDYHMGNSPSTTSCVGDTRPDYHMKGSSSTARFAQQVECPRSNDEVDIRVQVLDVFEETTQLRQRLDRIYRASDRSCECSRIEQNILSVALDLFRSMGSEASSRENWLSELQKTNLMIRDSLDLADNCRRLCRHGRQVTDVLSGSVIVRVKCRTLTSVVDLCHLHASGELHMMLLSILGKHVTSVEPGLTLRVTLDQASLQICQNYFVTQMDRDWTRTSMAMRQTKKRPTSATGARSEDSLLLYSPVNHVWTGHVTQEPLNSPLPGTSPWLPIGVETSYIERKFSQGEVTRTAFQELNISDIGSPSSPSYSRFFRDDPQVLGRPDLTLTPPHPLNSPNILTSPRLLKSPGSSPLTSPRKLKVCDLISEQENIELEHD